MGRWPEPAVALFDLDGTLVDTKALYLESYRRALAPLVGRRLTDDEIMALHPHGERRFLPERVAAADVANDLQHAVTQALDRFYTAYSALHDRLFGGVYPGVPATLDTLRRRGLRLGIVTGKSRRAWERTATGARLGAFDVVITDDDVARPKPDPQGILLALRRLDAPPTTAVYVGDSSVDILAAHAAGVRCIAAFWSRPAERIPAFLDGAAKHDATAIAEPSRIVELLGA
jgi:HAD superfamily hydrolase (TIGR01509 family)